MRAIQCMPNLSPIHQIQTVEDRYPRKIFKCRIDQVIISADPAYGRIGMKSWNDRILESSCHDSTFRANYSISVTGCNFFLKNSLQLDEARAVPSYTDYQILIVFGMFDSLPERLSTDSIDN